MENRFFYGLLTLPLTAALLYSFQNQGKSMNYRKIKQKFMELPL